MRNFILGVFAALVLIRPASAHIGETTEQCIQRYGQPLEQQVDDYGNNVLLFEKNGFEVFITYLNGKAAKLQYQHSHKNTLGFGDPISDNEVQILLKSNYSGEWKKSGELSMSDRWESDNGEFFAESRSIKPMLFVSTKEFMATINAAKKAKETKNLQGM